MDNFSEQINEIIEEIEKNPDKLDELSEEQITEIQKKLNPYGATLYGDEKYTCVSFTNLKEKYLQKLLMTSLVGFCYQMNDEYEVDEDDLEIKLDKNDYYEYSDHPDKNNKELLTNLENDYYKQEKMIFVKNKEKNNIPEKDEDINDFVNSFILSDEEEILIRSLAIKKVNSHIQPIKYFNDSKYNQDKQKLIEEQTTKEKKIITKFLNRYFTYNPKYHTTESYNKEKGVDHFNDPERVIKNPNNKFLENIPSQDVYSRFRYYYEVNYEELREAVKYLYSEKPDIEVALNIYDTFDTLDEAKDYINKNKDKIITNMLILTNYKWNLIGPFKENRKRIDFFNKNTQILENIMKQQEDDEKIGKALLKDRIKKKKIKNIKEYGKTDPAVLKYLKENPTEISAELENIEITDDSVKITEEIEISETGAAVDEDGVPLDAVEIGVTSINLKKNTVNTSKIYSKAKKPEQI